MAKVYCKASAAPRFNQFLTSIPRLLPPWEQAYAGSVRVIARGTLNAFVRNRVDRSLQRVVKEHLDAWYAIVSRVEWQNSAELKSMLRNASIVSRDRVVFNIKGNDLRLVTAIDYAHKVVFILWLGTHREYDRIDVNAVEFDKERYADSTHSH